MSHITTFSEDGATIMTPYESSLSDFSASTIEFTSDPNLTTQQLVTMITGLGERADRQDAMITAHEALIAAQNERLDQKDASIITLNERVAQQEAITSDLKARDAHREEKLQTLQEALQSQRTSASAQSFSALLANASGGIETLKKKAELAASTTDDLFLAAEKFEREIALLKTQTMVLQASSDTAATKTDLQQEVARLEEHFKHRIDEEIEYPQIVRDKLSIDFAQMQTKYSERIGALSTKLSALEGQQTRTRTGTVEIAGLHAGCIRHLHTESTKIKHQLDDLTAKAVEGSKDVAELKEKHEDLKAETAV
ncbi:uncharacterized protein LTR77_003573 [Saxophila tyrrhenica]|uniref:Uncharacterized protein n=1 Tax=Saxophila tyrrhenica TaxID=1690608 RepID=A0AAV9PE75_9PEZI|nr:hypothetical protein LTR77_003573 [Saxophila tyrrhenica]